MNFNKRGLGKGLDALLATSNVAQARKQQSDDNASQQAAMDGELRQIAVTALRSGQYQPRKVMAADALTELANSIRAQGVIQPIVVRRIDSQSYEIIAGERRWQAARQAGLQVVPCIIKNVDDRATVAIALIENIQREDLNAIEEARALERLQQEFSLTHQQVADAVGKSRAAVSNLLRLNQLSDAVKQLVEQKQLEMGHARALLSLDDQQQLAAAQIIINKLLTVREAEKLVKTLLNPTETPAKLAPQPQTVALQLSLSERFGTKVAVNQNKNGKGKIVINFDQQDKLAQILAMLGHEL
ncbi:ParB/RepB/Spo0J family partition protein [Photobacterium carnosum]|uniref:Probable chromosome-partitioning protein ParB n=1 Tax=Photobacterium carnosum TaxID=2023717 RepID=A0A2N4UPB1_9GAMM|nr:ParB/RepB/Spo0J family partition protein [Photobacterium carnosum]KAE8176078.1 chromosome partitioning protein ParB [Photobacterium carnosum]MCD9499936.1 ParB/RepB/Spo0J family partition protein [Photobacterium carnosum]MCD9515899.1 ParB/RepB/Spo0J family partition protein [Photobacterium carnosum]MCD9523883.1 ParB/RepB/Spo0J family partition protein [Photobacterium carnosum]MCD9527672.1 ParB/RepB/Spo0J family partition protein [Photobacterium carnosum]